MKVDQTNLKADQSAGIRIFRQINPKEDYMLYAIKVD